MDSGWLLADGEAVASALRVRTPWARHRAAKSARRGEIAAVLHTPTIVLGPLDVICVRNGAATAVRTAGRRPVWMLRPGIVVVVRKGDAARCGMHKGSSVELKWTT
jgi:mannose-6-phosphate isomerase-like protein (cupin superfamily)